MTIKPEPGTVKTIADCKFHAITDWSEWSHQGALLTIDGIVVGVTQHDNDSQWMEFRNWAVDPAKFDPEEDSGHLIDDLSHYAEVPDQPLPIILGGDGCEAGPCGSFCADFIPAIANVEWVADDEGCWIGSFRSENNHYE